MRSTKIIRATLAVLLFLGSRARAQDIGIIDEPDIGLRAKQYASAPVAVHSFSPLSNHRDDEAGRKSGGDLEAAERSVMRIAVRRAVAIHILIV